MVVCVFNHHKQTLKPSLRCQQTGEQQREAMKKIAQEQHRTEADVSQSSTSMLSSPYWLNTLSTSVILVCFHSFISLTWPCRKESQQSLRRHTWDTVGLQGLSQPVNLSLSPKTELCWKTDHIEWISLWMFYLCLINDWIWNDLVTLHTVHTVHHIIHGQFWNLL